MRRLFPADFLRGYESLLESSMPNAILAAESGLCSFVSVFVVQSCGDRGAMGGDGAAWAVCA